MALANRFFTKVLGLDSDTAKKVSATIRASGSGQQVQDSMIRRRVGPQAFTLLSKGIGAAKAEKGTEAKDGGDEKKPDADGDKVPDWADKKPGEDDNKSKKTDKKEVKEGFTLKSFLMNEEMVDVDLSDPQAAMVDIRKTARIAQDPNRLARKQMIDARQAKQDAAEEEGPAKTLKMQIARKQQELVMLNKRLRQVEKSQGAPEGETIQ